MRRADLLIGLLAVTGLAPAAAADTVAGHLAQGYRIVDKTETMETLPGVPPYADLPRRVLVSTYRLQRDADTVHCAQRYDSQQDALTTVCE